MFPLAIPERNFYFNSSRPQQSNSVQISLYSTVTPYLKVIIRYIYIYITIL